ncbi:MAG: DUF4097 family beta strand repeat-containing protein [Acidimicrobiia bacterium]|nr:DUF4097 family beta strand repeat-containing protein [Acidimicrobiia bacterium]
MSERIESFRVGEAVRIVAATRSGDIRVVEGVAGAVEVTVAGVSAAAYVIEQVGEIISVEPERHGRFLTSSADIVLTVPAGASLELACTSGDIDVQGRARELRASVASGNVRANTVVTTCRVNSASGDIRVGSAQDAEINTASGTVRLGHIERSLRLNAASGNVFVDTVGEYAICKVASSDVRIDTFEGSEIRVKSMSGDLHLGIPQRRIVELDFSSLSGRLRNKLPTSDGSPSEKTLVVSMAAVSGDITLTAAGS